MMILKEHVGFKCGADRNLVTHSDERRCNYLLISLGVFNLINREPILAPGTFTVS